MKTPRTRRAAPVLAGYLAGAAGLLAFAGMWIWLTPAPGTQARIGGPFTLVADDGSTVTDHSFPGKTLIVYFGYTACEDVCPATLNTLSAALGRLGARAGQLQPLFITLDPLRDSPPILHRFVKAFTPRLIGLTGSPDALHQAASEYRVVSVMHQEGSGPYALDHSSVLFVVSPDGRLVAPVPAGVSEAVMAQAIARSL